jgi:hypothetical protein
VTYSPCKNGIHVCGISGDETEFVTVGNRPGATRETFEQLRTQHGLGPGVDPDLVVDWVEGGDIISDFGIRRQSLNSILPPGLST